MRFVECTQSFIRTIGGCVNEVSLWRGHSSSLNSYLAQPARLLFLGLGRYPLSFQGIST